MLYIIVLKSFLVRKGGFFMLFNQIVRGVNEVRTFFKSLIELEGRDSPPAYKE